MSELSELIRINKSIENQNKEIIRLLKIIAGEADYADRSGYVYPEFEEETPEVEDKFEEFENLLDNEIAVGEVYFMDGDIYKYSVENNEGVIDNLMGGEVTTNFNAVEKISNESISRNERIDDGTVKYSPTQVKETCQKHWRYVMSRVQKRFSFHGIR